MTKGTSKKKQCKRLDPLKDIDDFDIDWDLVNSEVQSTDSTNVDCTLTEMFGREDDSTLEEHRAFDFSDNEKFDFFVEVMAEENSCTSDEPISTATVLEEFDFPQNISQTQASALTQDSELSQSTIQREFQIPTKITLNQNSANIRPSTRSSRPKRADGMRLDVAANIYSRNSKRTNTKYDRLWKQYNDYCTEENLQANTENAACHFFHDALEDKTFGVGSIWCVYASINNQIKKTTM